MTIVTGDLNAEKNIVDPIFENFENISSHYSHITLTLSPEEMHHLTLIDHILVHSNQKSGQHMIEPVAVEDIPDPEAVKTYKEVFAPLINTYTA